jgi:hypothetical protein
MQNGSLSHEAINHTSQTVSTNVGNEVQIGKLTSNFPRKLLGSQFRRYQF